jgi:predicted TIM-barrel enzyme
MEWIFDGIGTAIINLIIGAIAGGAIGYRIGIKSRSKQVQKAESYANQNQSIEIGSRKVVDSGRISSSIKQVQKAGEHVSQVQVGRVDDGKWKASTKSW